MAILGRSVCRVVQELNPVPCDAAYASFGASVLSNSLSQLTI